MTGRLGIAAACAATLVLGVAACGGYDDDEHFPLSNGGTLKVGTNEESFATQLTTHVAIEEGYFADEGINDVEVVATDDYIERLRDSDVDIVQGDTAELMAAGDRTAGLEEEVLLLAGHRARDEAGADIPVESIATTADFLDAHVDVVHSYLAAQLEARRFIYDEDNKDEVFEIMRSDGFEVPPEVEAAWDEEHAQISEDAGFSVDGMDELVRAEQARGRLADKFDWQVRFNLEALLDTQEEAGIAKNPSEREVGLR